jgi:hypothetical protein
MTIPCDLRAQELGQKVMSYSNTKNMARAVTISVQVPTFSG